MAVTTIAQAIARATGGFRLQTPTAAARRAVTQNILVSAISAGVKLPGTTQVERLFRRAGLGVRSSDFTKIFNSVVGKQTLNPTQRRVLDRQGDISVDEIPPLRDIPTIRQTGVSAFVIRAQVEVVDPNTGSVSSSWITINTDFRLNATDIKALVPDFGFQSGSEQLLQTGDIIELNTFKRSPTTTIPI